MSPSVKSTIKNPLESASLISRLFFWWTLKLFKKGVKYGITIKDLYPPLTSDKSKTLTDYLSSAWTAELKKSRVNLGNCNKVNSLKPSLLRAIAKTFWLELLIIGISQMVMNVLLVNWQPVFQNWIIDYFEANNDPPTSKSQNDALVYAGALTGLTFAMICITQQYIYFSQISGMRFRVACSSLVYRKVLRLSKPVLDQTPVGQVINLLSNDVNRFDQLPVYINYLWISPLQVAVIGYLIWRSIGIYTLVGYGVLLLITVPMQGYVAVMTGKLRNLTAKLTDRRIQLMSELISGIQVIKMYVWEKSFDQSVKRIRSEELGHVRRSNNLRGLYSILSGVTQRMMLFLTLVTLMYGGGGIDPRVTFQLAIYFNILQLHMADVFPTAIVLFSQTLVTIKRVQEFLLLEEVKKGTNVLDIRPQMPEVVEGTLENKANPGAVIVKLDKVSANWKFGQLPPTLCDVSLKIKGGELCTLVGPVGSGKSSLLNVLLQELPVGAGTVELFQFSDGETAEAQSKSGFSQDNPAMIISYASQDPWIFTGSVRENILFGQEYHKARYQEVAKVCSLLQDFKQLPEGDLTIVGERGASLSGGQRARINLARAIYRPADLYLLDDPLSAVDARVSRQLFQDCVLGYLKGKTRILVTHQLNYLKQADSIIEIDRGTIKQQGSYQSLQNSEFLKLLENVKNETQSTEKPNGPIDESRRSLESHHTESATDSENTVADEVIGTGFISKAIYYRYFREGGGIAGVILLASLFIITQAIAVGVDQWMTYWTTLKANQHCNKNSSVSQDVNHQSNFLVNVTNLFFDSNGFLLTDILVYIHLALLITFITLSMSRCYYLVKIGMRATRRFHDLMLTNVLQASMYFFNTNPSGRLLNRFSKDVGVIDEVLMPLMLQASLTIFNAAGTIVNIVVINPWMIILTVVAGLAFYLITICYLMTSQDAKRLEGITKSPIYTHVASTFNGLTTIRSRGMSVQSMLRNEFDRYQDINSGAWYLLIGSGSAYGFSIDIIACFFIFVLCFSLILIDGGNSSGASVGLAISQSLTLTNTLQWGIKQSMEVQSQMTAVERVIQYTDLPKEGPIESSKPVPENWPSEGRIQWKNVYLSYKKDDPAVLKNIDLMIEPGWKIGVVGRTGAGKSSLISVLFRLVDDGLLGQIMIDGVDTKTIGLQDLRSSISIIPQEPVLFSETLRYNLDPFGKYTDIEIWDALREVELNNLALDQWVTEGGTNFSVGQRQLICLARALLRNNRILVLDEATANIDSRTDALIQRAIRSKFADCTVITIAHRLNTIINSNRILVMDNGCAAEFDTPYELLIEKPDGIFAKMVEQTGPSMTAKMIENVTKLHRELT